MKIIFLIFCACIGWGVIWSQRKYWELDDCWEEKRACFSLCKARFLELLNLTYVFFKENTLWFTALKNGFTCLLVMASSLNFLNSYHGRFKDRNLNIMCASSGGLRSSPATWSARCWWIEYKLQSGWASSGLCLASDSELLFLHSSMIALSPVSSPGCKLSQVIRLSTLYASDTVIEITFRFPFLISWEFVNLYLSFIR